MAKNKEYYTRFPDPPEMKGFEYLHLKEEFKLKYKVKGSTRATDIIATKRLNEYIEGLDRANPLREQLLLEREFCRTVEKERLKVNIKAILNEASINGVYSLREVSNVLGLTHDRVRQIESTSLKVLKHPTTGGVLKQYLEEYNSEIYE